MKKFFLRNALLYLLFYSGQSFAQKHVIGSHNAGFFSAFFGVLHHLYWCEKAGHIPVVYWGKESFYWQKEGYNGSFNAWEYFFEPVSSETVSAHEPRDRRYWIDGFIFCFDLMDHQKIELANRLIKKYIKVKAPIRAKLESFFDKKMAGKKTIGIHLRGTDKYTEVKVIDPILVLKRANKEAELLGECQFFIATDEYRLLKLAKKVLKKPVIYYPCERSGSSKPLHILTHKAILGEEVLIEALLLARCDLFLHSYSNVSVATVCFNTTLEDILLT